MPVTSSATRWPSPRPPAAPVNSAFRASGIRRSDAFPGRQAEPDVGLHFGRPDDSRGSRGSRESGSHLAHSCERSDFFAALGRMGEMPLRSSSGRTARGPRPRAMPRSPDSGVSFLTASFFPCTGGIWCARSQYAIARWPWNNSTAWPLLPPASLPHRATSAPPVRAG